MDRVKEENGGWAVERQRRTLAMSIYKDLMVVDPQARIFQMEGKRYCYSADVFARMLNVPCGGEDLKKVLKKYSREKLYQHFDKVFSGATGYKIDEFKNFGGRRQEEKVMELLKNWNWTLLNPGHRQYCSKGNLVAALEIVSGKAIDFPTYKSDLLHGQLCSWNPSEGSALGARCAWGVCERVVLFHNTAQANFLMGKPVIYPQPPRPTLVKEECVTLPSSDGHAEAPGTEQERENVRMQEHWSQGMSGETINLPMQEELSSKVNLENVDIRTKKSSLCKMRQEFFYVPLQEWLISKESKKVSPRVGGQVRQVDEGLPLVPVLGYEDQPSVIQGMLDKGPVCGNLAEDVCKAVIGVRCCHSGIHFLADCGGFVERVVCRRCEKEAEIVEQFLKLEQQTSATASTPSTPKQKEKVGEESSDNQTKSNKIEVQRKKAGGKPCDYVLADLPAAAPVLLSTPRQLVEAEGAPGDGSGSDLAQVCLATPGQHGEMAHRRKRRRRLYIACTDDDLTPVASEEMKCDDVPEDLQLLAMHKAHSEDLNEEQNLRQIYSEDLGEDPSDVGSAMVGENIPRLQVDQLKVNNVLRNVEQALACKKTNTEQELIREAALANDLEHTRKAAEELLAKESALHEELESVRILRQEQVSRGSGLEKEIHEAKALRLKHKAAEFELQTARELLSIESQKLLQKQEDLANFEQQRLRLELEKSELELSVLRATKMAKLAAYRLL